MSSGGPTLAPTGSAQAPTGSTVPSQSSGTPQQSVNAGSNSNAPTPGTITITERFFSDNSWLKDLHLNLYSSNWELWNESLSLRCDQTDFLRYLSGSLACPDPAIHLNATDIWDSNDLSLKAFILQHISHSNFNIV